MRCAEVEKFVHPYLDGEFLESDRALMDVHLASCAVCRELVAFQSSFKSTLRARLRHPAMPEGLEGRLRAALDRADASGEGPARPAWVRLLPAAATVAVAATLLLLFGSFLSTRGGASIANAAVRAHEKNLPVEVAGNEDQVRTWMVGKVGVPVHCPRFPSPRGRDVALVGARMGHLDDRDAAQLVYKVRGQAMTVQVFDASGMELSAPRRYFVADREVYFDTSRGYNVVFYADRGVGYAFTSDLAQDEMLELVSQSLSR